MPQRTNHNNGSQYNGRFGGIRKKTWWSIFWIVLFILVVFEIGKYVADHTNEFSYTSPLATRAYAMELPPLFISPAPASLPERQANTALIRKLWGSDADLGIKIAYCESGLRSDAQNHNTDGSVDEGVFQINSVHGMKNMTVAEANIAYARLIFLEQGTTPWESSKHCWGDKI